MKRRAFISLLGVAAAAWPLAARAQQPAGIRRVGVLIPAASDDREYQARLAAFLQGLQQLGWADGRNVRIDARWGAGDAGLIRKYAAPLSQAGSSPNRLRPLARQLAKQKACEARRGR